MLVRSGQVVIVSPELVGAGYARRSLVISRLTRRVHACYVRPQTAITLCNDN